MIPKTDLQPGAYYYGRCRNATVARWDGTRFWYWRAKFEARYLEAINHPADFIGFDCFTPRLRLDHVPVQEIPLDDMPEVS